MSSKKNKRMRNPLAYLLRFQPGFSLVEATWLNLIHGRVRRYEITSQISCSLSSVPQAVINEL